MEKMGPEHDSWRYVREIMVTLSEKGGKRSNRSGNHEEDESEISRRSREGEQD